MATDPRKYKQGVATLGFSGGPSVVFRLNPDAVDWNFQINTAVTETVGGRVVQVLGATLSDMTIKGSFGEARGSRQSDHAESWELAEAFLAKMKLMADYQSRDAREQGKMHPPAIFSFPPKNWRFSCYIKDLTDPDGGHSLTHRTGKFSYAYVLTLMIDGDLSDTSQIIGQSNGVLEQVKDKAIANYLARVANGIGWHISQYNGGNVVTAATPTGSTSSVGSVSAAGAAAQATAAARGS